MLKKSLLATVSVTAALLVGACDQSANNTGNRRSETSQAEPAARNDQTARNERADPNSEGMPRGTPDRMSQNEAAQPSQGTVRGGNAAGESGLSGAPAVNPNVTGRTDADGRPVTANDALVTNPSTAVGFATRVAVSDLYEIESSRLAVERTKDDSLRRFAQMMVDQHTQTSSELKSTVNALQQQIVIPTQLDTEHQQMMERLRTAGSDTFDAIYKSQQLQAHERALELMRGYAANGDTETLRALAKRTQPIIEKHLAMVRDMVGTNAPATPPRAQGGATMPSGSESRTAR
jgi:putative membrane protein